MNEAWGFCKFCAFEVPLTEGGALVFHERDHHEGAKQSCLGSGRKPTPQPGPEAKPVKPVKLAKTVAQINAKKRARDARAIRLIDRLKLKVEGYGQ